LYYYRLVLLRPDIARSPVRAPARRLSALPARRGMPCAAVADFFLVLGRMGRPALFKSSRPKYFSATVAGLAALRAGAGRDLDSVLPSTASFLGVSGSDGLRRPAGRSSGAAL